MPNAENTAESTSFDLFSNGPPEAAAYTSQYLIDRQQIVDVVNALCLYAELGQWDVVRRLLGDSIKLDYSSMTRALSGSDHTGPQVLSPDELVLMWRGSIPGFDFLQHLMTHHMVRIEGRSANCICQVHATHLIGKDDWIVLGRYEFELANCARGWKVNAMTLHTFKQIGIESVRTRAGEAMERRGNAS